MLTKQQLTKIHDYLWEIPKTTKPGMKVPARFYADEKMLDQIMEDRSIEQLINVATLPGVEKYSLAMPDIHEGYGFPIGGVAGIDAEKGVISPGGVGYDISCLPENSKVLHSLGYSLPIRKFETTWPNQGLRCTAFKKGAIEDSSITLFLKRKANPAIYEIVTTTGKRVSATSDHPFYSKKGMVPLENLKEDDEVAIYPYGGVSYEAPAADILVDEKRIRKLAFSLKKDSRGHGLEQIINQLKKRNLLPLKTDSSQFPYLLKVMGYVLGDGAIYFVKKRGPGFVWFYGKSKDLELIRKDIKKIGFTPSRIYLRTRDHKITTSYATYKFSNIETSFKVTSSSFALLLITLGVPLGNKTRQDYLLPSWILKLSLWQKRLFLAALFGAELNSPKTITGHGFNFYPPVLGMNKREKYIKSGKKFLLQISKILREFGIETQGIIQKKEQSNKNGEVSYRLRLVLSGSPQNLCNLWSKIGYEYHSKKQFLANVAVHFIKSKQSFIEEKILSRGIRARTGVIKFKKLQLSSLRGLIKQGGKNLARPFIGQFPTFRDFIKIATQGLGESGIAWDQIKEIKKKKFSGWVYDFTVNHPDHNFIANNFVVSNCGVRLLGSDVNHSDLKDKIVDLTNQIQRAVPSGVGRGGKVKLDRQAMDKVLKLGAKRVVEMGYADEEDLENCEEGGAMISADPAAVSDRAKKRGNDQCGTLGSGNHFLEIQKVEQIFDENVAKIFGLFKDQITIMIHSGSRGLGHQVCTDYVQIMQGAMAKYNIKIPDRELACVPFSSTEGQKYFKAMAAAANFAWANRLLMAYLIRGAWKQVLGETGGTLASVYDVAHNIAKLETHAGKKLVVHRKGATRAFGPGQAEIPEKYRAVGQPVLIPGSMGTASYVLVGTEKAMQETFGSVCHGAGRRLSRSAAKREIDGGKLKKELEEKGIIVRCGSAQGLAEEAPLAYKDVDNVVEVVAQAGLAKKVARLVPLAVVKGD